MTLNKQHDSMNKQTIITINEDADPV